MNSSVGAWSFYPLVTSFAPTVLPNIAYWNVTNGTWEYQVQVSWPLNWTSQNARSTVETLYVLDGNAQAQTATEAFRRIRPNDPLQPDTIIVSIGYPHLPTDSPYADGRYYDYQIPVCATCPTPDLPGVSSGGEAFLKFLDTVLRPWVHASFPNAKFDRDALYGHSFSGLFTVWTLMTHRHLFDTYLAASPYLIWNDEYLFEHVVPYFDGNATAALNGSARPALQLTYGGFEQYPPKRRRETVEAYTARRAFLESLKMEDLCLRLYDAVRNSPALRHVEIREYPFSYHPAVGGNAIADGLDYFLDWE